jgi:phosphonate transport system permease protein
MASTLTTADVTRLSAAHAHVLDRPLSERMRPWLIVAAISAYLLFCWWFFALGHILGGANWTRGGTEIAEWFSWQSRPDVAVVNGTMNVKWPPYDPLGPAPSPDWVRKDGEAVTVTFGADTRQLVIKAQSVTITNGSETASLVRQGKEWVATGPVPAWLQAQAGRYQASFGFNGGADIMPDRVSVRRRFLGWANFVFDPDSPFWGKPMGEVVTLFTSGERIDPKQSNLSLAFDNIWNNSLWQHGDVWIKLLQTIVMAFVGTLFAATLTFPLAFLAARTITASTAMHQILMRFFDFMRCVDLFVWSLFFTRGFGPGPLAGIGAIFFTEVGTLGKTYTEALENIDDKQREGVRSLGASPLQVQRYGVVPQVLPVLASQALYQWESNTRSATVIGAMGAGGIGLKLLESMRTGSNWANVAYMVVLILIVVYVIDTISSWLRHKLIAG